jgi:hypothetical protein
MGTQAVNGPARMEKRESWYFLFIYLFCKTILPFQNLPKLTNYRRGHGGSGLGGSGLGQSVFKNRNFLYELRWR